ncbi:MAG: hypothetical protein WAL75_04660 [Terracidiphilus sp.]
MSDSTNFRELLLAYLLDELPADERACADQQMLVDDDYSAMLKEAEYDLLDAYAAGELTGVERDRVYRALVSGKEQDGKTEAAAALQRKLAGAQEAGRNPAKAVEMRRRRAWLMPFTVMAAAVVLAAGLTVSLEYLAQHKRAAEVASQVAKPAGQAPASNSTEPVSREDTPPDHSKPAVDGAIDAEAVSLVLPSVARSSSATVVKLFPQTRFLRVEWPGALELATDQAQSLQLEIADDRRIVVTTPLASRVESSQRSAVFQVPAKALKPGSYLFRVVGRAAETESGPPTVLSENSVTVTR